MRMSRVVFRNTHSGAYVSLGGLYAMERIFDFSLDSITAKDKTHEAMLCRLHGVIPRDCAMNHGTLSLHFHFCSEIPCLLPWPWAHFCPTLQRAHMVFWVFILSVGQRGTCKVSSITHNFTVNSTQNLKAWLQSSALHHQQFQLGTIKHRKHLEVRGQNQHWPWMT